MCAIKIRPAQVSDAPCIGSIGHAAWLRGIGAHVSAQVHERISADTFESFARTNSAQIVVAENVDSVVGFAATEDGDNYISDLWVAPDFEGRGIGSSLVSMLEKIITNHGYDTAEVEVLTANDRALKLYRHLGYKIVWQGTREDEFLSTELHKTILAKTVVTSS